MDTAPFRLDSEASSPNPRQGLDKARLIVGTIEDGPGVPDSGGASEGFGPPDGVGAEIGLPDPLAAFVNAAGFHDIRLISEPVSLTSVGGGALGTVIGDMVGGGLTNLANAALQSQLHQFIAATAGTVLNPSGAISISLIQTEVGAERAPLVAGTQRHGVTP